MACRMGGMYGGKYSICHTESQKGGGNRAAGTAAIAPGRAQWQLLMDGTAVKSAFALLSAKVTKEGLCPDASRTANVREDSMMMCLLGTKYDR